MRLICLALRPSVIALAKEDRHELGTGRDDARPLALHPSAEDPHSCLLGRPDHPVRGIVCCGQLLLGEGHRAIIERDQVLRHLMPRTFPEKTYFRVKPRGVLPPAAGAEIR